MKMSTCVSTIQDVPKLGKANSKPISTHPQPSVRNDKVNDPFTQYIYRSYIYHVLFFFFFWF